jgi:hypothetical protein
MGLAAENYARRLRMGSWPAKRHRAERARLADGREADALTQQGRRPVLHQVWVDRLRVVPKIGPEQIRRHNIKKISDTLKQTHRRNSEVRRTVCLALPEIPRPPVNSASDDVVRE